MVGGRTEFTPSQVFQFENGIPFIDSTRLGNLVIYMAFEAELVLRLVIDKASHFPVGVKTWKAKEMGEGELSGQGDSC